MAQAAPAANPFGHPDGANRRLASVNIRFQGGHVAQGSAISFQVVDGEANNQLGATHFGFLMPAHLLMPWGDHPNRPPIEEMVFTGAHLPAAVQVAHVWHLVPQPPATTIEKGTHFVVSPGFKCFRRHKKEAEWAAVKVDRALVSKAGPGGGGGVALGGPGGFFSFPAIHPSARRALIDQARVFYRLVGYPAVHLIAGNMMPEWLLLVALDPLSLLLQRTQVSSVPPAVPVWDNVPPYLRQYAPEPFLRKVIFPLRGISTGITLGLGGQKPAGEGVGVGVKRAFICRGRGREACLHPPPYSAHRPGSLGCRCHCSPSREMPAVRVGRGYVASRSSGWSA
jgi:hypothetical protein